MSKYSGWGFDLTFSASGDLSDYEYYFVEPSATEGYVSLATGASSPAPIGVLQSGAKAGNPVTVRVLGTTQVYGDASTAIAYGDFVTSGSDGQAVIATASFVEGVALEALSTGEKTLIEVLLSQNHASMVHNTP